MLKPIYTKSFRKDLKLMGKRGWDLEKLGKITKMIINEQPLPPKLNNHPIHGEWEGAFDCHIQGDWVLIYKINPEKRTVTFHHTGSHSDLF